MFTGKGILGVLPFPAPEAAVALKRVVGLDVSYWFLHNFYLKYITLIGKSLHGVFTFSHTVLQTSGLGCLHGCPVPSASKATDTAFLYAYRIASKQHLLCFAAFDINRLEVGVWKCRISRYRANLVRVCYCIQTLQSNNRTGSLLLGCASLWCTPPTLF